MKKLRLLIFLLLFSAVLSAQSTWHYLPDAPTSSVRIDDVFFLNAQIGWSAAGSGEIYKTSDGGTTWEKIYEGNSYFRCIEFYNENIGYAGTLDHKFLRTTDGGNTWTNLAASISPSPAAVCGISIPDSLVAYAVGEWDSPGFLLKTTDGGATWSSKSMAAYANALVDVFFLNRDTGFVTGKSDHGATILYTTDGGDTWAEKFSSNISSQYVWKIQRVTPEFWVASIQTFNGGRFAKSLDGGMTWTVLLAPVPDMEGIGFATPLHGWVGGYVNGFWETFDGGEQWEFKNFGGNFNRFYFLDSGLGYASGWSVYKFSDSTASSVTQPFRPIQKDDFRLRYSPNPTHGVLDIQFTLPVQDIVRMSILSPDGAVLKMVYHQRLSAGDYAFKADCTALPPGAYLLGVQRNHGIYTYPFIKF